MSGTGAWNPPLSEALRLFQLREWEGEAKVNPLSQAIGRYIQPGMSLYVTREASASLLELCRQFWGSRPQFTLISSGISNYTLLPIYGGLVRKLITSVIAHPYPTPGPIGVVGRAEREGMETEIWPIFALELRLMAGALGWSFIPTRSLLGSDLARENRDAFQKLENPFDGGELMGIMKGLTPDVSLVHGLAADPYGNTILPPPFSELWGARAGKKIIVTVEKVVSTDFIRRHSPLVKVPGYLVTAVCEAPLGAHPWGLSNHGSEEIKGYEADYDFMLQFRKAAENPSLLDSWLKDWLFTPENHGLYLKKLGEARVSALQEGAKRGWQEKWAGIALQNQERPGEIMVVAASRKLQERVREKDYRTVLGGAGTSALASWLAYYLLQQEGYHLDLVFGGGQYGYSPRPGIPILSDIAHTATAKMHTDTVETWGLIAGGSRNRCLAALGAAQVDKYGNINSTQIGGARLFGSGGANDATQCQEIIVLVAHPSPKRLLEKVPYITVPGQKVSTLITQLAVLEKRQGEFHLTAYFPGPASPGERLQEIQRRCGWELKIAPDVQELPPPTPQELLILRYLDPQGFYTKD